LKWIIYTFIFSTLPNFALAGALNFHGPWDEQVSSPKIMGHYYTYIFSKLPHEGKVAASSKYWSGGYWALNQGNINYRWYARNKIGFNHYSPSFNEAKLMTIPQLAELSPSEKYDLFIGRYDYPLRNEVAQYADPRADTWEGICHGWAPATMNHNEPLPKLLINPDGIEIPFGSTDIKALLSYYYANAHRAPDTFQVGRRCFKNSKRDKDCDDDLNAGAFHVILTNRLGIQGKGFIADLYRLKEVWNHPVVGYSTQTRKISGPSKNSATGTEQVISLRTKVTYVDENGPDWHPVIGTSKQELKNITYDYEVEINSDGEIIGGEWLSKNRPDFLWLMTRPRKFEGILWKLSALLSE
jgi:hypothetical protein